MLKLLNKSRIRCIQSKETAVIEGKDEGVVENKLLRYFYLVNLSIKNCSLQVLPKAIFKYKDTLINLSLANNSIKILSDEFCELICLKTLDLSGNDLKELPKNFANFKELEILNLTNNKFGIFPTVINKLPKLKEYELIGNPLSTPRKFIESFTRNQEDICYKEEQNYWDEDWSPVYEVIPEPFLGAFPSTSHTLTNHSPPLALPNSRYTFNDNLYENLAPALTANVSGQKTSLQSVSGLQPKRYNNNQYPTHIPSFSNPTSSLSSSRFLTLVKPKSSPQVSVGITEELAQKLQRRREQLDGQDQIRQALTQAMAQPNKQCAEKNQPLFFSGHTTTSSILPGTALTLYSHY